MEREKIKGKAKASASWARLIHEIFEVDPLLCPNCGKEMKIIATGSIYMVDGGVAKRC